MRSISYSLLLAASLGVFWVACSPTDHGTTTTECVCAQPGIMDVQPGSPVASVEAAGACAVPSRDGGSTAPFVVTSEQAGSCELTVHFADGGSASRTVTCAASGDCCAGLYPDTSVWSPASS